MTRAEELEDALAEAADDLGKAANQFDSLAAAGRPPQNNGAIFAEKEARARAVLRDELTPEREAELLRWAAFGKARFTQDRHLTRLGNDGFWEIEVIGEEPCTPYVAHGNITVDREAVVRSRLTEKGQRRLEELGAN